MCPFLKSLPNMRFKKLQGCGIGNSLVQSGIHFKDDQGNVVSEHSPEEIFAYSPKVASLPEFEKEMQELDEFYKLPASGSDLVDERGFLVIKNKEMANTLAKDFKKYPGIKVEMEDASGLFYRATVYIKTLDLSGVKSAKEMFREARVYHLGKVEGTEDLEDLTKMFYATRIQQLPDMNCPKAWLFDNMFDASTDDLKPVPPSTLVLGSSGFADYDWSGDLGIDYYTAPNIKSMMHTVFGDAQRYFSRAFPWEMRKMSEAISSGLAEKY